MGQGWSMLMKGFLEASESEEDSESLTQLQQSQATTEASSSVAAFENRGLRSTCPKDIELSNLQSSEATVDTRRGTTPPQPASHFSSVKGSLKDSEAPCTLQPHKLALEYKVEAYREALRGQFSIRNLARDGCAGAATPRSLLTPDVAKSMEVAPNAAAQNECEMLHSESHVMVGRKRKRMQSTALLSQAPLSPAQTTLLMFQLDPKRRRPSGLPGVAFHYAGLPATNMKPKASSPAERPSEVTLIREAVLDLGTGDSMVGRLVKKVIVGQRKCHRGHVSSYDVVLQLYEIQYDDGKEEVLEWLDLEPHLIAKGRRQSRPRYKTVDELIYTKQKRPSMEGKKKRRPPRCCE